MPTPSKVNEVVNALRDEEARLKQELSEANDRVREIKSEIARVQKGIKGLSATGGAGRKGRKRKKTGETESPMADGSPSVFEAQQDSPESCSPENEFSEQPAETVA